VLTAQVAKPMAPYDSTSFRCVYCRRREIGWRPYDPTQRRRSSRAASEGRRGVCLIGLASPVSMSCCPSNRWRTLNCCDVELLPSSAGSPMTATTVRPSRQKTPVDALVILNISLQQVYLQQWATQTYRRQGQSG